MDDELLDIGNRMANFLQNVEDAFSEDGSAPLLYRTSEGGLPNGKAKVYFTCHPSDFPLYFERLTKDVLQTVNCAVYYTADMSAEISSKSKAFDLGSMNLFIVPVTYRLLCEPCRAMECDIAYAKQENIPILPCMMESGLETLYARPEYFGSRQYLEPNSTDVTQISYAEKLRKYLTSVLISDESAQHIREAFDARIFLSYRKKDRYYANELMRLIHSDPRYRSVAVWYDEFLTPGESFNENIKKALDGCQLFTLLVTPNLLEEPNGKPNFVMGKEYPAAQEAEKPILPAEMLPTDRAALQEKYPAIPACIDPHNSDLLHGSLDEQLSRFIRPEAEKDPEQLLLIGLAYRDGIDVETDRERGVAMITEAAEAGYPAAMEMLCGMYADGVGVPLDYRKATSWCERLVAHYRETEGEASKNTVETLSLLAYMYNRNGNYSAYLETAEALLPLQNVLYGAEDPRTLAAYFNTAAAYSLLSQHKQALNLCESIYPLCLITYGSEHTETLAVSLLMAQCHCELGAFQKALNMYTGILENVQNSVGGESAIAAIVLSRLCQVYAMMGDTEKALGYAEEGCELSRRLHGADHPETLLARSNLANLYLCQGDAQRALEIEESTYLTMRDVLGEKHPITLKTLSILASVYQGLEDTDTALSLAQAAYDGLCETLGEEHADTLDALSSLALFQSFAGQPYTALRMLNKVLDADLRVFGLEHLHTAVTLEALAYVQATVGDLEAARSCYEDLCRAYLALYGEDHEKTQNARRDLQACEEMISMQGSRTFSVRKTAVDGESTADILQATEEALALFHAGDAETALAKMTEVYVLAETRLGDEHEVTQKIAKYVEALRNLM